MTLDEAIKHAEEKAKEKRKDYERACSLNIPSEGCLACAEEHEQLAEWLRDYQQMCEVIGEWYADYGYHEHSQKYYFDKLIDIYKRTKK